MNSTDLKELSRIILDLGNAMDRLNCMKEGKEQSYETLPPNSRDPSLSGDIDKLDRVISYVEYAKDLLEYAGGVSDG